MICLSLAGHTENGCKVGVLVGAEFVLAVAVLFDGTKVGRLDTEELLLAGGNGGKPELTGTGVVEGRLVRSSDETEIFGLGAGEPEIYEDE